jgi:hypothetical protein
VLPNLLTTWQRGHPRKRWGNDTLFEVERSGSERVFRHKWSEVKSNDLPGFDHSTCSSLPWMKLAWTSCFFKEVSAISKR